MQFTLQSFPWDQAKWTAHLHFAPSSASLTASLFLLRAPPQLGSCPEIPVSTEPALRQWGQLSRWDPAQEQPLLSKAKTVVKLLTGSGGHRTAGILQGQGLSAHPYTPSGADVQEQVKPGHSPAGRSLGGHPRLQEIGPTGAQTQLTSLVRSSTHQHRQEIGAC